jgi:pimeloyl-ACP methyl ester carboxylesterase
VEFVPAASDRDVDRLLGRLAETRWPPPATDASQGPSLERIRSLAERWRTAYDWERYRRRLASLPQLRTEIDGLVHHAIHLRSTRPDAVPLLLGHGWPSTCFEFDRVAPLLAEPECAGPAFHVVAPSLPGYGFSDIPTEPGWNAARTAAAWAALMGELGYDRFVAHGGDWGAIVATELALGHPDRLIGLHLTMPVVRVTDEDRAAATGPELAGLERERAYRRGGFGYATIQLTRPQTLGYALDDSPVGLLAWLAEKLDAWSGRDADGAPLLDDDAVLDVVSTYWLTRTATSAARMYYESLRSDLDRPVTGVRTGCSIFADEIIRPPRAAVERRYGPLASWREVGPGGHFPAAEVPGLLAEELRGFVAG